MTTDQILRMASGGLGGLAAWCFLMCLFGFAARRLLGDIRRRVDDVFFAVGVALLFLALALRLARDLVRPETETMP